MFSRPVILIVWKNWSIDARSCVSFDRTVFFLQLSLQPISQRVPNALLTNSLRDLRAIAGANLNLELGTRGTLLDKGWHLLDFAAFGMDIKISSFIFQGAEVSSTLCFVKDFSCFWTGLNFRPVVMHLLCTRLQVLWHIFVGHLRLPSFFGRFGLAFLI